MQATGLLATHSPHVDYNVDNVSLFSRSGVNIMMSLVDKCILEILTYLVIIILL